MSIDLVSQSGDRAVIHGEDPRAWSFMTVEAVDRQYGGNLGYNDVFGEQYVWTHNIANGRQVREGDIAVLRDKRFIFGIGWIDEIQSRGDVKIRRRCPSCGSTGFKQRKSLKPTFKCSAQICKAEFNVPVEEKVQATYLTADYSRTWREFATAVPARALRSAYLKGPAQQAINALDPHQVRALFSQVADVGNRWWTNDGGIRPTIGGGIKIVLGRRRIGQAQFRDELLRRFGARCAITGQQPAEALEAAHLYRFSQMPEHDTFGGLLLRRDLHTLFDRWLLAIDTSDWTVRVAPKLMIFPALAALDRQPLDVPPRLRPTPSYVEVHYSLSLDCW